MVRRLVSVLSDWLVALGSLAVLLISTSLVLGAKADSNADSDAMIPDLRSGTWTIDPGKKSDTITFSILWTDGRGSRSQWGHSMEVDALSGLTRDDLERKGPVSFELRRDAGTFRCTGHVSKGRGAGTYELDLDPRFADALEKRGIGRPTEREHASLAFSDVSYALLDALAEGKYPTPTIRQLVRMANHGVDYPFLRGMADAGYRFESIDDLISARDHGVDPAYVREMAASGYENLEFEDLKRARDHGVTGSYVAGMRKAGYEDLSMAALIQARDHGVDPRFAADLAAAGYRNLSLRDLIRARDHGVDGSFARRATARVGRVSIDQLISLRDRGEIR